MPWPDGMANEILQMQRTHLRVQQLDVYGKSIGEPQYWPLTSVAISDAKGAVTIRPFVTRVEYRKKKAKAKAEKAQKPLPDDDAEVSPDKPLAEEPLERED